MNYKLLIMFLLISQCLWAFPIRVYDFRLPTSTSSPVEAAMGGLNVASSDDFYLMFSNPSLLRELDKTNFSMSFVVPPSAYDRFADVVRTPPFLKNNNLRSLSLQSQQFGFGYLVLAEDRFTRTEVDSLGEKRRIYQDYRLNSYAVAFSDAVENVNWGLTGKFLSGRLVYLAENFIADDSTFVRDEFIDSIALGLSIDLGISQRMGALTYGVMLYDVYSVINWRGHRNGRIRTRMGAGLDLDTGNISLGAGINSRWMFKEAPFYNAYYAYRFNIGHPDSMQHSVLRAAVMSRHFRDADDVLFCFGIGYFFRIVRFDLSLQSKGWKANETQYMFSLSIGE